MDKEEYKRRLEADLEIDETYLDKIPLPPLGDNIGFNSGKIITEDEDPDGKIIRVGDFLAPPRCIGLGCARDNVGKTGLGMKLTSLLTQHGIYCLYLVGDQLREYLNPYHRRFNINKDFYYMHSFREFGLSLPQLKKLLDNYKNKKGAYPQFIAIDSGSDFEIDAQLSFMPLNKRKSQERFNYNEMSHILYCYRHLLYPLANGYYTEDKPISIFQFKHMPKKSFDLPHSYKEPAMTEVAWLLFNQQVDWKNKNVPLHMKLGLIKLCSFKSRTWGIYGRRTRFGDNRFFYVDLAKPEKEKKFRLRRGYYVCDYTNLRVDGDNAGYSCPVLDDDSEKNVDLDFFIERFRRKKGRQKVAESYVYNQLFRGHDRSVIEKLIQQAIQSGSLSCEEFGERGRFRYQLNENVFPQSLPYAE